MFNNVIIDVAISLVFIYLLYSLLASIVQELISTKLAFRSKILEKAIIRMLEDGKSTSKTSRHMDRVKGLFSLFGKPNKLMDKQFAAWFYAHPLIKYLAEDNFYSKPGYLSAKNFSKVILDLLKGFDAAADKDNEQINASINEGRIFHLPINLGDEQSPVIAAIRSQMKLGEGDVAATFSTSPINKDTTLFLKSLWRESNENIDEFRGKLEGWYDDTMERASGWYKRYIKYILFIIGLLISVGFNVDTISMTRKLMRDPKLREQMVQNAGNFLEKNQQLGAQLEELKARRADTSTYYKSLAEDYERQKAASDTLMAQAGRLVNNDINNVTSLMALGWSDGFLHLAPGQNWTCIIGWIISAMAISLGAPFWFDMLNKLMKARGSADKTPPNNTAAAPANSGGDSAEQEATK